MQLLLVEAAGPKDQMVMNGTHNNNTMLICKLCDFGLSHCLADDGDIPNVVAGTPEWMAPEVMRLDPITSKVSLGYCFFWFFVLCLFPSVDCIS